MGEPQEQAPRTRKKAPYDPAAWKAWYAQQCAVADASPLRTEHARTATQAAVAARAGEKPSPKPVAPAMPKPPKPAPGPRKVVPLKPAPNPQRRAPGPGAPAAPLPLAALPIGLVGRQLVWGPDSNPAPGPIL